MLHISRQPGGLGCRQRKTDLEGLYYCGAREADGTKLCRNVEVGTVRCGVVVVSHRGSCSQRDLCEHRRKLLRSGNPQQRCSPCIRYGNGTTVVVATVAAR